MLIYMYMCRYFLCAYIYIYLYLYIYIYNFSFFVSPKRENNKYFKMNRFTKRFVFLIFRLFILLVHMFISSYYYNREHLMMSSCVIFDLNSCDYLDNVDILQLLVLSFSFYFSSITYFKSVFCVFVWCTSLSPT